MSDTTAITETAATESAATKAAKSKVRDAEAMKAVAAKAPTSLQKHYTTWLAEKTGFTFSNDDEAAKIVQLAVSLYHDYQASPERAEQKALEASTKTVKAPSKVKQELAARDAEIAKLKAELEAAKSTPAERPAEPEFATSAKTIRRPRTQSAK
jgi:hypothetical protein